MRQHTESGSFDIPKHYGEVKRLPTKNFYNCLQKLCQLEKLDVICMNRVDGCFEPKKLEANLVASLFHMYCAQFTCYTEHYLLYYLYQSPLVKQSFTNQDLIGITTDLYSIKHNKEQAQDTIAISNYQSDEEADSDSATKTAAQVEPYSLKLNIGQTSTVRNKPATQDLLTMASE